jgi:hypothetical protein
LVMFVRRSRVVSFVKRSKLGYVCKEKQSCFFVRRSKLGYVCKEKQSC